jgi:hypothetical protein
MYPNRRLPIGGSDAARDIATLIVPPSSWSGDLRQPDGETQELAN